jgi:plastocyanin
MEHIRPRSFHRPTLVPPRLIPPLRAAGLVLVFAAAVATAPPLLAANHQVTVGSNFFNPAQLTIEAGDTVTWTNTGGMHNVRADDDSFRCAQSCDGQGPPGGDPSGVSWSVTLTFDQPGTVPYYCEAHGAPGGLGMAGSVTVQGAPSNPGTLRFENSSFSVSEGAPVARVGVLRQGGDDGQVSVSYATGDGSATAGSDYQAASGTLTWPDGDDSRRTFDVPILGDGLVEGDETLSLLLSLPTGGASLAAPSSATLRILDDDQAPAGDPGSLAFSQPAYGAAESDADVAVGVVRSGGSDGAVSARLATSDGSATAGDDYAALSQVVAFADGEDGERPVAVPLLDDGELEGEETFNLTLTEPTGGAALGDPAAATVTLADDDVPAGPCVADDTTLCLHDDRFRVQVSFRPPGEDARLAHKIDLSERAGLFWFFNPANVEMLLKVQNACVAPFDRWWVFLAATTNVEYTVRVLDTEAGVLKTYSNAQGQAAEPVQDTDAFDTCP